MLNVLTRRVIATIGELGPPDFQLKRRVHEMRIGQKVIALTAGIVIVAATSLAHAQVATSLEQAEMAGLSPEKRAEVQARLAKGGQTVTEILQTILLNSIKLKQPANRIVALDFSRGVAVIETADGKIMPVRFDTTTLAIQG